MRLFLPLFVTVLLSRLWARCPCRISLRTGTASQQHQVQRRLSPVNRHLR